ncbi:capsule assembly Wzi family protein [Thalassotalea maritima]|uniref:capsule assembly Wzi family protein n=1 Tax=Thalassotalea maritima TaxID=3242416 RepID=UPI003527D0B9
MLLRSIYLAILLCLTPAVLAKGVSPYLPLKLDAAIEIEIERLVSISKLPALSKPYHVTTINQYLAKVKDTHPHLYQRLSTYMERYKTPAGITHLSAELTIADDNDVIIPNSRGQQIDDAYRLTATGFLQANSYFAVNLGGTHYESGGFMPHGTYLSAGWDVFQVDIGYREHWLAPHHEGALVLTTQAKPVLMATFSNSKLITDWNIKYELSVGILDEMDNIAYDGQRYSGEPGFLTMHLSFQPFDWWTLGGNRALMFGGGERSVTLSDVWQAIIDPVNSDNCGGSGTELQDCKEEVGNQIASITSKFDFSLWNYPISLFAEYGGEDTGKYSNYRFGNIGQNYGIFLPYVTESTSLNIEWSKFHSAWYVHGIYGEGFSNDGNEMGHWWGDNKTQGDRSPGEAISTKLAWDNHQDLYVIATYRTATYDTETNSMLSQRSHEIDLELNYQLNKAMLGINLYAGRDNAGEDFISTRVSYFW